MRLTWPDAATQAIEETTSRFNHLILGLGIMVVYFLAAKIGLIFATLQPNATTIWAPSGIALAAFLLFGHRVWPTIFIAAFLVNITTAGTVWTSLGIAFGNTVEGVVGYVLISNFANGRYALEKTQDAFLFLVLGPLISTTLSASIGVGSLFLGGFVSAQSFSSVWITWWLGDLAGMMVVTPLMLFWVNRWHKKIDFAQLIEDIFFLYILIVVSQIIFSQPTFSGTLLSRAYLVMPILAWMTMRSGQREVSLGVFFLSVIALWNTLHNTGPFSLHSSYLNLIELSIFISLISGITLIQTALVKERRQAERHFKSLIEHGFDAVSLLNREIDIIYTSPSTEHVLGYKSEEFVGLNVLALVHPEDRDNVRRILTRIMGQPGQAGIIEARLKNKEGQWIWIESNVTNLLQEPGVRAIVVNYRDITERKQSEQEIADYLEELAEEEARDDALINSLGDALVATDEIGQIVRINRAFEEVFGFSSEQALGKYTTQLLVIQDDKGNNLPEDHRALAKAFRERAHVSVVHWLVKKDGTKFPATVVATPVILEGNIVGAVEIIHDITKEQEAERIKSDFISIASHQLRTPLTAIRWATERLLLGTMPPAKVQTYLTNISLSVQRLSSLVDRMLNLSRIESGALNIIAEDCDAIKLTSGLVDEYMPLAAKNKLKLIFSEHPDSLPVTTDTLAYRNIAQNLISNALEYTPEGGQVEVKITPQEKTFILSVSDTGIGIPTKEYSRIFQRFGRASNALLTKADGTGIGLYVADQAARRLGGKMWFTSVENKGSIFYVEIPKHTATRLGGKRLA
jgi:PAS domain S-box-containing protein